MNTSNLNKNKKTLNNRFFLQILNKIDEIDFHK
jgi:hypothetical protein